MEGSTICDEAQIKAFNELALTPLEPTLRPILLSPELDSKWMLVRTLFQGQLEGCQS